MKLSNRTLLIILGALCVIIFAVTSGDRKSSITPVETYTGSVPANYSSESTPTQEVDRTKAYVIAKQFAKEHIGSADYGWGDDGFVDYGNGNVMVTGVADLPGRRIRWTVELQYNGGDWNDKRNWTEKGFVGN